MVLPFSQIDPSLKDGKVGPIVRSTQRENFTELHDSDSSLSKETVVSRERLQQGNHCEKCTPMEFDSHQRLIRAMVNLYGYIDWPVVRGWKQEGGRSVVTANTQGLPASANLMRS